MQQWKRHTSNLHEQKIFAEEMTFFIKHISIFVSWVKISECPPQALGHLQVIWIWTALHYWMHVPNSSMSRYLLYSKIHKHNRLIHERHSSTNFLSFRQISPKLFVGSELSLHCAGTEGETGESWKVTFEPWDVLPPGCGGAQLTHTAQGHHHMCCRASSHKRLFALKYVSCYF